ncbi:MAG: DNA methyltransferase, partial [bacterium]
ALEGLKQLEDDSIDAIVSDPPYQLSSITKARPDQSKDSEYGEVPFSRIQAKKGFMGKEWDVLPNVEVLKESLRVLKPGAFALWLMTPRQDSQLEFLLRLRKAGFMISFTPIYWVYASGFPKAMNISKAVDRKLGAKRTPTAVDQRFGRANSGIYQMNVDGEDKQQFIRYDEPATPEAKKLNGSYGGFQPKPAVEVIIVSMKPLSENSYVEQALNNGKGITWLEDCRIPYASKEDMESARFGNDEKVLNLYDGGWKPLGKNRLASDKGRFPANLLVSDNVLDIGVKHSVGHNPNIKTTGYGSFGGGSSTRVNWKEDTYINDSGDLSRYFSLDAWWDQKLEELPDEIQKIFPFLYVPKASRTERNKGLEHLPEKKIDYDSLTRTNKETADKFGAERKAVMQNHHPTVKPIKLMSYLITLTTREGDVVLDPFIGSGTTAISAILLNRKFIGFEREPEYFTIATERIKYYQSQSRDYNEYSEQIQNEYDESTEQNKPARSLTDWLQ